MRYGLTENNLESIKRIFRQYPAVKSAYLYGSRAKGNYKPSSDIDVALKGDKLDLKQLTGILLKLDDLLLPYQFDVSIFHQIDNPELIEHITRVGIILYEN